MNRSLPYAEDMNYWKTGKSSPDVWMGRAKLEIAKVGGIVLQEAYGSEEIVGRGAYMIRFSANGIDEFKLVWPVLPVKGLRAHQKPLTDCQRAAKIQAATMLFHDVKSRCVAARVFGIRTAFFAFLVLPSGQAAAEITSQALQESLPFLLSSGPGHE